MGKSVNLDDSYERIGNSKVAQMLSKDSDIWQKQGVINLPKNFPSVTNGASSAVDLAASMFHGDIGISQFAPDVPTPQTFVPMSDEEFATVQGPFSVIATKDMRVPAFMAVQDGVVESIKSAARNKTYFNEAGLLHAYIEFNIPNEERYTVTGIYVGDPDAVKYFKNIEPKYISANLHYGIIRELIEKFSTNEEFLKIVGKSSTTKSLSSLIFGKNGLSSREKINVWVEMQSKIIALLWGWGEETFVHEVRQAALNINKNTLATMDKLADLARSTFEVEASRKERRPPEGPLGTYARIENRLRRNDIYEAEEGISRWWDTKMNQLRLFHVLPEQRFDTDFGVEFLMNPPYDFRKLMFPFEEFGIAVDSGWIDTNHVHDERCNHPDGLPAEVNLYKPCGYIIRGSREAGVWHLYEKYIARNEERDCHMYTAAVLDERNGSIHMKYNPEFLIGQPGPGHTRNRLDEITRHTIKFIVNFVLVLNHRSVKVTRFEDGKEPGRPVTRQQRRALGYQDLMPTGEKRDHFKIHIPAKSTLFANEVAQGINVKERRPHDVRGHLRTDKYGRKRIRVKEHRRCRNSNLPYFMADYDAANVGME
jgi:hypothetical protein